MKKKFLKVISVVLALMVLMSSFTFANAAETTVEDVFNDIFNTDDATHSSVEQLFKDYVEGYIKFTSLCNEDSFITGFRFGARFAYDTFVENRKG